MNIIQITRPSGKRLHNLWNIKNKNQFGKSTISTGHFQCRKLLVITRG